MCQEKKTMKRFSTAHDSAWRASDPTYRCIHQKASGLPRVHPDLDRENFRNSVATANLPKGRISSRLAEKRI